MESGKEIIKTWKWRILKAGYKTIADFCNDVEPPIMHQQLGRYLSGKISPTVTTFDRIEGKLREKGV